MSNTLPFTFNTLKHHVVEVKEFIANFDHPLTSLEKAVQTIGHAKMDLYVGSKTCQELFEEVTFALKERQVFEKPSYKLWLAENGHYRQITLSDTSIWVLRLGQDEERFIHLHPGKKSPHTLRIKANTLKTAIAVMIYEKRSPGPISPETLNDLRSKYLALSPVGKELTTSGLELLRKHL